MAPTARSALATIKTPGTAACQPTVALVGSFRRHYAQICAARQALTGAGCIVTTPSGEEILNPEVDFVRLQSDKTIWSDCHVQALALHRILRADVTYVVAPDGYVGRTTSYEIGRAVQAGRPVYFSEPVVDLPLEVPSTHVLNPTALATLALAGTVQLMHTCQDEGVGTLERRLIAGDYVPD